MNLANLLTLSRIPLMFIIVALLYVDWLGAATVAFVLFVVAGVTDWLDGLVARRQGLVSTFGILMDALTDKVLMLGLMIALVDLDKVSIFLVLLILGREFMITGMRLVAATKGVVVSAERAGKQKTVTQILSIGAFLLAGMVRVDLASWFSVDLSVMAQYLDWLGLVLFLLATVFTLTSGYRYFRKYGAMVFAED
ncbi:MAG: CDP-diacylglycerol--glycerol-3-phosphate 3-phosphatidyltransferase [Opitutaceae bacterium]